MVVVTRSRAGIATDRELRNARVATLKSKRNKAAAALVRPGIQKRKRPAERAAVPKAADVKRPASASERAAVPKAAAVKRPASASDRAAAPKEEAAEKKNLAEASSILKLKNEAFEAQYLWEHRHDPVGAVERWVKAKAEEAKAEEAQPNKTKMVMKTRLTREFIDLLKRQQPALRMDYPDDDEPDEFVRHLYAMLKYMNSKMYDYQQALIDQYNRQGYADDESDAEQD